MKKAHINTHMWPFVTPDRNRKEEKKGGWSTAISHPISAIFFLNFVRSAVVGYLSGCCSWIQNSGWSVLTRVHLNAQHSTAQNVTCAHTGVVIVAGRYSFMNKAQLRLVLPWMKTHLREGVWWLTYSQRKPVIQTRAQADLLLLWCEVELPQVSISLLLWKYATHDLKKKKKVTADLLMAHLLKKRTASLKSSPCQHRTETKNKAPGKIKQPLGTNMKKRETAEINKS